MARESGIDAELLRAALIGYQIQRERMAALIADIETRLGHGRGRGRRKAVADTAVAVAVSAPATRAPKRKRKLSAAGRARIVAATKARWEAYRAAKAGK